ncbi:MAG: hypothetical protein ACLQIQ_01060 [Beijerinckiaceae bacterium]
MRYVLLAFGILLALAGSFALAAGYATVFDGNMGSLIAGTVALSAGVLVLGQVFILGALDSLKACVERRANEFAATFPRGETPFEADASAQHGRSDPGGSARIPPAPLIEGAAPHVTASDFGLAQMLRKAPAPVGLALGDAFMPEDQAMEIDAEAAIPGPQPVPWARGSRSSETKRPEVDAAPGAAHTGTDLLLEAALTTPPIAHTARVTAGAIPAKLKRAPPPLPSSALTHAPTRASPTLSEMWRRVTAKTAESPAPPEETAEQPLPPPAEPESARAAVSDARDFAGAHHEADSQYADEDLEVAPGHADGGLAPEPRVPSAIDAELGNWFDRALAGVDEPAAPPPVAETSAEAQTERPSLAARTEDGEGSAAATNHIAPISGEPSEVGRYEADGTTYVMFSDGSIEAQSEQGVYRFGSMAELKAFFEDQSVAQ